MTTYDQPRQGRPFVPSELWTKIDKFVQEVGHDAIVGYINSWGGTVHDRYNRELQGRSDLVTYK